MPDAPRKYRIVLQSQFRKGYARCARRGFPMDKLDDAMRVLASGARLAPEYNDHPLKWDKRGLRECHVGGPRSDWLLAYRRIESRLELVFVGTGFHRELGIGD